MRMWTVVRRTRRWLVTAALMAGVGGPVAAEPPTLTGPGPPRLTAGTLTVSSPVNNAGAVFLRWEGTVAAPMAAQIEGAFEAFKASRRRFVLVLNSGGGSVGEGEKVIALLQRMRKSHQVDTAVERGARCGSMCVPIYLQGESRFGARSSAWLFHEITLPGAFYGRQKKVEGGYKRLIDKYWVPAGVSRPWIDRMLQQSEGYDYWQTGDNLINEQTGIITRPIENRTKRNLEADAMMPAQQGKGPPTQKTKGLPAPTPATPTVPKEGPAAQPAPVPALPTTPTPTPAALPQPYREPFGGFGKKGGPPTSAGPIEPPAVK
ncbi:MAG: hypothetical protein ACKVP7_07180 [Hyphomicrobiaceae bacterium]